MDMVNVDEESGCSVGVVRLVDAVVDAVVGVGLVVVGGTVSPAVNTYAIKCITNRIQANENTQEKCSHLEVSLSKVKHNEEQRESCMKR